MKSLKNNQKKGSEGFTIVELLIVIVIIGILAAITIVAYNGIQNRAKTARQQTNARTVANKAEAYAADNYGVYPANKASFANSAVAKLPNDIDLRISGSGTLAASDANSTPSLVEYATCTNPIGARVRYWDYTTDNISTIIYYVGGATSSSTCTQISS